MSSLVKYVIEPRLPVSALEDNTISLERINSFSKDVLLLPCAGHREKHRGCTNKPSRDPAFKELVMYPG